MSVTPNNPLAHRAVLASLHINIWTGWKADVDLTDTVHQQNKMSKDAGMYHKRLVPRSALAPLFAILSEARRYHHEMTSPWLDGGTRILSNVLYIEYAQYMQALRQKYMDVAVPEFVKQFNKFKSEAQMRLGPAFKPDDFPKDIASKFALEVVVMPCPDQADFRCEGLDEETVAQMKKEAAAHLQEVTRGVLEDACNRVMDIVGHMVKRLEEYKPATGKGKGQKAQGVFRDSLVENVRDLAKLLPAFNITGDKKLDKIIAVVNKELCVNDAETLREDPDARAKTLQAANKVLEAVNAFMA